MGVNERHQGQMTIELLYCLPWLLAVALVSYNCGVFFTQCAQFDRLARNAIRVHFSSPAEGTSLADSCELVRQMLARSFTGPENSLEITAQEDALWLCTVNATLIYRPTLFGLRLKDEILGIPLPPLKHSAKLTVARYKPGIFF